MKPAAFDPDRWRVIVSPYIWGASLDGDTGVAGYSSKVAVPFSETLKNLDFSFMGNVEVTNGSYGFYIDGQYTQTSQKESLSGYKLKAEFDFTVLSAGAFFRALEIPLEGTTLFGAPRVFAIEPTAGLRWTRLNAGLTVAGYERSHEEQWTDLFVGARFIADLSERWNLFAEADVGGFNGGSDLSLQGQAYLGYRTHIFNQPTLLRVGYRALYQDYSGGSLLGHKLKWDVTEHGPVAGVSIRF